MVPVTPVLFIGIGTTVNVATIAVGALAGVLLGDRMNERTRRTVTDVLGLMTLVIGALNVASLTSHDLVAAVGSGAALIVVLGALLIGAIIGSVIRIEDRFESLAGRVRDRFGSAGDADRARFVEAVVTSSLVFCIGPLTIMGSLTEGLGRGADQLLVKAVLDGFAAMAFASALGPGVLASAGVVLLVQGGFTALGWLVGDVLPAAYVDALTATGGVMLLGLGVRLLRLTHVRVGDLLPALLIVPALVAVAAAVH